MSPTPVHLQELHQALLLADDAYANEPTPTNHRYILEAQRAYYVALRAYHRTAPDLFPKRRTKTYTAQRYAADLWLKRASIILDRAQHNLQRQKQDAAWQELALHQYRRARQVFMRAQAQADMMLPPKPPKPPKRKRELHPITRRYVYVDL